MFIGNEYLYYDLFKMNVMTIVTNDKNKKKNASSSYLFESCDVWHGRLGYVNYNYT